MEPQSQFGSDLKGAVSASVRAPWLLAITVAIEAGSSALDAAGRHHSLAFLTTVGVIVYGLTIGFYGTQRVWLFRLYGGESLTPSEVWTLSTRYFRRFAALGAWFVLPLGLALGAVATTHNTAALLVTGGVLSYLLDVVLTFVVPELTFRTASVRDAWRSGRAMLRDTWPASRWYVLAPGLAVLVLGNLLGGTHRSVWGAALEGVAAGLLSLVFRAAILRYYLRLRPETPNYSGTQEWLAPS